MESVPKHSVASTVNPDRKFARKRHSKDNGKTRNGCVNNFTQLKGVNLKIKMPPKHKKHNNHKAKALASTGVMTPQIVFKNETRKGFYFETRATTNVQPMHGGVYGEFTIDFKTTALPGFNEIAPIYDQLRMDRVTLQFSYDSKESYPGVLNGVFAYDPDGYTTGSGSVLNHTAGRPFTVSMYRSSPEFVLVPGYVIEGMAKSRSWFDLAATLPVFHCGGAGLYASQPHAGTVSQISVKIMYIFEFSLRGKR